MLKGRHLLEPMDLTTKEIDEICLLADKIISNPNKFKTICQGQILATLFFEPSTRTRLSFEAAMLRLGGSVIGFSDTMSSSIVKGESIADTIKTVACYADIIAIRHPKEGAPKIAAMNTNIPVINAGDGGHHHPTQTLTDILTIKRTKKRLNNLTIGLCGDLKFGRTVHSLIKAMSRYKNNKFVFIASKELRVPDYIIKELNDKNIEFKEVSKMEDVLSELDILYMTRVQKERFFNEADYIKLKDSFILDKAKMLVAKKDMIVMHPLPRVNEISTEIDSDSRAYYFEQAKNGMYVRMALIMKLLGVEEGDVC